MKIDEGTYAVYDNIVHVVIAVFKNTCNLDGLDGEGKFRVANINKVRPFYLQRGDRMSISYTDIRGVESFRGILIKSVYMENNRTIISYVYEDNGDYHYQDLQLFRERKWVT